MRFLSLDAGSIEGGKNVAPEASRITILLVECEPRHRQGGASSPVGQQSRLPEPSRGTDKREISAQHLIEGVDET